MNKIIINKILEAAVQAPSGDNVQPWELKVSERFTMIKLYNLPDKDDSYYNFNQMASYISHGAVIENIVIASRHFGFYAQVNLFPNEKECDLVAMIKLVPEEAKETPLYQAIFERCTNRFQFKKAKVTTEMMDTVLASVKGIDNVSVKLISQKDKVKQISKELMVNDRLVFERKDIHGFLFDKIRWNKKQIEETMDGMPVSVLGLTPIEKLSFPLMKFWSFVKMANYFGLSRIVALKCWWNCRTSTMLGMVSVKGSDKVAFVQGGRAVQRVWLETTLLGLSLQPIIGLTLLIYRLKNNELNAFSRKHQKIVRHSMNILPTLFNTDQNDTLVMGFRIGAGPTIVKTKRKKIIF